MMFVIKWGPYGHVGKSNTRGYPSDPKDPNTKTWTTFARAQKYLSLKDPSWAADCAIVELPNRDAE